MQKYLHVKLSSILSLFWKEPSLADEGNATERYEKRVIVEADHLNKVLKSRGS